MRNLGNVIRRKFGKSIWQARDLRDTNIATEKGAVVNRIPAFLIHFAQFL